MNTTKKAIERKKYQFSVNPEYSAERTGNYELRDKITAKWQNYVGGVEGSGNVAHEFYFDLKKQTFTFSAKPKYGDEGFLSMYQIISPALMLYRLIATFFGSPRCFDGYKMIWGYTLIHRATGKAVEFGEWKGAVTFFMADYESKRLDKGLKADIIELMNYLISEECAHPYDNLVAGSVA